MTITRTCSNSWNHFVWWGRIAEWSMSGFVTTTCPGRADRRADRRRRVAVVRGRRDRQPGRPRQLAEFRDLVLDEGLGRKEEQRACCRILGERLEDRQRIAQGLARGRWRDHDHVPAGANVLDRLCLVRVELLDSAACQPEADPLIQPIRHRRKGGLAWRHDLVMEDAARNRRLLQQVGQDGLTVAGA